MNDSAWNVAIGDDSVTVVYEPAAVPGENSILVCAHGAGGHMADRSMLALSKVLTCIGLGVVRFNFLYREKKSSRPDPMPRLEQCFSAVVDRVRQELNPATLLIGGRSMGGRAGSMMAAKSFRCDGLLLFAYPLHPAGQPEKLRSAHLASIEVPVLCFNGTRDALCTPDLMSAALETVKRNWTMHWLEDADHSFHVLKSSGRTDVEVLAEVGEATRDWIKVR